MTDSESKKLQKLKLLQAKKRLKENLPHLYGFPWYKWAWEFFTSENKDNYLCAANQISKAIADDEVVPTPNGFVRVRDVRCGDLLFGADGNPTKVTATPFIGTAECFRVTFDDGESIVVSGDHVWACKTNRERYRKSYGERSDGSDIKNASYGSWVHLTTRQIIERCKYSPTAKYSQKAAIPLASPVKHSHRNLFDPYLVGLLIGDGSLEHGTSVSLSTADQEIWEYVSSRYECKRHGKYGIRIAGITSAFDGLGLRDTKSHTKFIPDAYKRGSVEERIALLSGLLDTDGTASKEGLTLYATTSERLAGDVVELVGSLGGKAYVNRCENRSQLDSFGHRVRGYFTINIKLPFQVFRLSRKRDRVKKTRASDVRVIDMIEPVGIKSCRCFSVDAEDGLFLVGKRHVVTRNSSTQIRKCIHWATEKSVWKRVWPNRTPLVFWYLYPTKEVGTIEFEKKWEPEFLPRGEMKDDLVYGWKAEYKAGFIHAIHFNSGISVYFKTYATDVKNLQTGTVDAIFCDEELPEELYDELNLRRAATDGVFHLVFTATMGQEFWREVIEERGSKERFKNASKWQVSAYDCLTYKDGTPSGWTHERIERLKNSCKSQAEIDRRIYGRFVVDAGLKYPSFSKSKNVKPHHVLPNTWSIYAGIDSGSGGENHPGAITFVAVSPDMKSGRVFKGWRADDQQTITSLDILNKYVELKKGLNVVACYYDFSDKDLQTFANSAGVSVTPANKAHDHGERVLNVLFKNDMLHIYDLEELEPLVTELVTLQIKTAKTRAKDDFVDSLRYACASVPWDFEGAIGDAPIVIEQKPLTDDQLRAQPEPMADLNDEFEEINDLYG